MLKTDNLQSGYPFTGLINYRINIRMDKYPDTNMTSFPV